MNEQARNAADRAWRNPAPVTASPAPARPAPGSLAARWRMVAYTDIQPNLTARYLVKGLPPSQSLIVAWGPKKSGKSFWIYDLAMHVACGSPYRGLRVRRGVVAYVVAEGDVTFPNRVAAWRERILPNCPQPDDTSPDFHAIPVRISLIPEHIEFIARIRERLGDALPALVVIDTLNRTFTGSESSDEDMTAYVAAADAVKEAFGCSVIVVHHCGHDTSRPRGHSSLSAAADTQIAIRRDAADRIIAVLEWNKDGPEGYSNVSRLERVEIGRDEDGDPVASMVIQPCDEAAGEGGGPPGAGRARLSPNLASAFSALQMALAEAGESIPGPHIPPGVLTVPTDLWRQYFYKRSLDADPDGTQDTRKKAFQRASKDLVFRELIGCWTDRVWIVEEP